MTLARLGIGAFHVADPDEFDVANFNRQYGALVSNLGRNKAAAMANAARDVNPELDIRVFAEPIHAGNVDAFLEGADLYVDGLDFFSIYARRVLFRRARERGLWAITAGPIGLSTAWLSFDPAGMSFDEYFDLHDGMDRVDQLVSFAVGLTPQATHLKYTDLSGVDLASGAAPSAGLACMLASGVLAAECLKALVRPAALRPAPAFCQFDAYRGTLRQGRLRHGNRGWLQQLKRRLLSRRLSPVLAAARAPRSGDAAPPRSLGKLAAPASPTA